MKEETTGCVDKERSGFEGERRGEGELEDKEEEGEARTVKSVIVETEHVATFGTSIEDVGKMEISV